METRHIRTFVAYDVTGREWTLEEYQEFGTSPTRGGVQEVPGLKSLKTKEGFSVNPLEPYDGKRFFIVPLRLELSIEKPKV
jgi:hypothetical protein